jgi:hypothetical protein
VARTPMSGKIQFVRKSKTSTPAQPTTNTNSDPIGISRGTRTWANQIVLTSSGSNQLDAVLGLGVGIPLGSVLLCIEDFPSRVHRMFAAMFVAEAITHMHSVALPDSQASRDFIDNCIPSKGTASSSKSSSKTKAPEAKSSSEMSIAWRYEKYVNQDSDNKEAARSSNMSGGVLVSGGGLAGFYDFRRKADSADLESLKTNRLSFLGGSESKESNFLDELETTLESRTSDSSGVTRVLVPSLGDLGYGETLSNFKLFLSRLRSIVDGKRAVALVTVPRVLFDENELKQMEAYVDASFQLSSFMDDQHSFGQSHGILYVRKLYHANTFGCQYPDQISYLYTIGKKGVIVEKMYMPPEESRTGNTAATTINVKSVDF